MKTSSSVCADNNNIRVNRNHEWTDGWIVGYGMHVISTFNTNLYGWRGHFDRRPGVSAQRRNRFSSGQDWETECIWCVSVLCGTVCGHSAAPDYWQWFNNEAVIFWVSLSGWISERSVAPSCPPPPSFFFSNSIQWPHYLWRKSKTRSLGGATILTIMADKWFYCHKMLSFLLL